MTTFSWDKEMAKCGLQEADEYAGDDGREREERCVTPHR